MRALRSDNNAAICPEALAAIVESNEGHAPAYGDDGWTQRAVAEFQRVFDREISTWFVATGSAANTLAVASLTEPWQKVICHRHSHYNDDESTAPERITNCRVCPIWTEDDKLTPDNLLPIIDQGRRDVHQPQPGVVTISNPTEFGTLYTPDETRSISEIAHAHGYRLHVDGARFANAVAALGCSPAELTADAGVDALSFGGTKNGLALGEAVVFFPQSDGADYRRATAAFEFHRKSTGHLLSKQRFIAAQFAAVLADGVWLKHAAAANDIARRLEEGLVRLGIALKFPRQVNGVFAVFDQSLDEHLRRDGHEYYGFGDPRWRMFRLMCSFDTRPEDVDALIESAAAALGR